MARDELDDLYDACILDHCREPRNAARLEAPDAAARAVNPFCGDEVDLQIELDGGRVTRVGVQSVGCSINQAAASMLSVAVSGKSIAEAATVSEKFRDMMAGDALPGGEAARMGDLASLRSVRAFPVRIKCALLSWTALEDALESLADGDPARPQC